MLAVNHAGRESIEFFEIRNSGNTTRAIWHGCTIFIGGLLNDVAAMPNGGFITTVMLDQSLVHGRDASQILFSDEKAGYLATWDAGAGFQRLPGTKAALNNSLQIGTDGKTIYFTAYTGKKVIRYDLAHRKVSGSVGVKFYPDNITKSRDGVFLIAGIDDLSEFIRCTRDEGHFCDRNVAFRVVELNTGTMSTRTVFREEPGTLQGASTALKVGNALYISTYTGDRILKAVLGNH